MNGLRRGEARTDAAGDFELRGLPPAVELTAAPPGGTATRLAVLELAPGETRAVEIRLRP